MEELQSALEFARRLDIQNLPDIVHTVIDAFNQFRADWNRAMTEFVGDLEAQRMATASILQRFSTSLWDVYNELTGREEDPQVRAERLRTAFNAQRAIMLAQIIILELEARARLADYLASRHHLMGLADHASGVLDITREILKGGGIFMDEAEQALRESINELHRIREEMPPAIEPGQVKPQGGRRGDGGQGGILDSVRDFISNRTFELANRGLSEYRQQIAQLTKEYDEQIKQAGKDIKLRTELIALKEKELGLINREIGRSIANDFQNSVKPANQFDQVRKTAADLIKRIEDSPFGNARKASMIGRVLDNVERQIDRMAR